MILEINSDLLQEAKNVVSEKRVRLPAEIPGFPRFFVARANDSSIQAIAGFVTNDGVSFKIGVKTAL